MEQLLLEVGQTIVELTVEDHREAEGTVLALVHDSVRILPLRRGAPGSLSPSPSPQPSWPFPTIPQGLAGRVEGEQAEFQFARIGIDVSELPPGVQSFSLVEFSEQVLRAATREPEGRVSLTPRDALNWGWQMRRQREALAE